MQEANQQTNATAVDSTGRKNPTNPVKAIRAFCLDCCGNNSNEVKLCTSLRCALYPFRFGKNPYRTKRELTEEQRKAAAERLRKWTAKRKREQSESGTSEPLHCSRAGDV